MSGPPPRFPQLHDEGWLREQVAQGHNTITLAAELGCSDGGDGTVLRFHGGAHSG
jgi:hypothetical protein